LPNEKTRQGLPERLLEAAEIELSEHGIEKISLRAVAKRAGVSHGAPAHHFVDAQGLLTALAAKGYERLLGFQTREENAAPPEPLAKIVASGVGYIEFAVTYPELFRLMFNSTVPDRDEKHFQSISLQVFERLVANTEAHNGHNPYTDRESMKDLMASWAVVHGLAELIISGRAERTLGLSQLTPEQYAETISSILLRVRRAG